MTLLPFRPPQPRRPWTWEYRDRQKPDGRDETARHARRRRQSPARRHAREDQLQRTARYPAAGRSRLPAGAQDRRLASRPAKFTPRLAFEDIDFTASRSISKAQISELYGSQWLHDARPVLLIGTHRRRQDVHRPGHRAPCLRLRHVGAVHDAHHLARESGTGPLQRHLPALPRQARQARARRHR
ncbi:MAG: ATP-binding protein [Gammaproteobacteria bacterium]|nr:ATP-binding protein [Gammaproteobacteria bacterium]